MLKLDLTAAQIEVGDNILAVGFSEHESVYSGIAAEPVVSLASDTEILTVSPVQPIVSGTTIGTAISSRAHSRIIAPPGPEHSIPSETRTEVIPPAPVVPLVEAHGTQGAEQ